MVQIRLFHCTVILRGQYRVQFGDNPTAADNSQIASRQFFNTISSICAAFMSVAPNVVG
jgi:hypothetical protein